MQLQQVNIRKSSEGFPGTVSLRVLAMLCADLSQSQQTLMQGQRRHTIWGNTKNLKNGYLISLYNNVPFIFECSQWREKASQKYQTKNSQNGPNVFLLSSSDRLAQYCVNLSVFERMLGSVILQPILPVQLIHESMVHICCLVRPDFSSCVIANLS